MSRFAIVACATACAMLALANVAFWHVEGWMPLGASAALAFVFAVAERSRRRKPVSRASALSDDGGTFGAVWSAFDEDDAEDAPEPRLRLAEAGLPAKDGSR